MIKDIRINGSKIVLEIIPNEHTISIIKSIEGYAYNPKTKEWTIPLCRRSVKILHKHGVSHPVLSSKIMEYNIDFMNKQKLSDLSCKYNIEEDFSCYGVNLFDYQKRGVYFSMLCNGRCIIADDLGLGKTIQAIVAADKLKANRVLVISPASVKYHWVEEIKRILPNVDLNKIKIINGLTPYDIGDYSWAIAGFAQFSRNKSETRLPGWSKYFIENLPDMVIIDEAHKIKSRKSISTKNISEIAKEAKYCILLSGTIMLNKVTELFQPLHIIDPNEFYYLSSFAQRYSKYVYQIKVNNRTINVYEGLKNENELKTRLVPFMIRRLKTDVLDELPDKTRTFLEMDLDEQFKYEYRKMEEDYISYLLENGDLIKANKAIKAEALVRANALMEFLSNRKSEMAVELLEDMFEEGINKIVCFVKYKSSIDTITTYFKGLSISGDLSAEERQKVLNDFINKNVKVLVLTYGAGAEGIDGLQKVCDTGLFVDFEWVPGKMIQAEDRLYRIGATKGVKIYYMAIKNTFDEYILNVVKDKIKDIYNTIGLDRNIVEDFIDEKGKGYELKSG